MKNLDMNRRDFTRLTAAAFGGIVAGTAVGCSQDADEQSSGSGEAGGNEFVEGTLGIALLAEEPHVCRGLNTCKGKGAGGDNECAGQGSCSSVGAHACAGQNDCKGQSGCGTSVGVNECKFQGGCNVPLQHGWEKVRAQFEEAMQAAGKTFGDAPDA